MRLFLFIMIILMASPAMAQMDELLLMNAEEEAAYLSAGQGARGRYTQEQVSLIAWRSLDYARPVEVMRMTSYRRASKIYHVMEIAVADGSLYNVVVNAQTGIVLRTEVRYLSSQPRLPADIIGTDIAQMMAVSTVSESTRGGRRPTVESMRVLAYKKRLAYEVQVRRAGKSYIVMVNALTGEMIDMLTVD